MYIKNYEPNRIEQEGMFADLLKVMEFLDKYVMDEELDEIYRIDNKYGRDSNVTHIK